MISKLTLLCQTFLWPDVWSLYAYSDVARIPAGNIKEAIPRKEVRPIWTTHNVEANGESTAFRLTTEQKEF